MHLHNLSLRFHLERKTGGLTRVLEARPHGDRDAGAHFHADRRADRRRVRAGRRRLFVFRSIGATSPVIIVTVVLFLVYTTVATNWRISIRRSMNESDTDANTKAIDSLLNFETVKYFSAEQRESARYDKAMERYERMSVRTYVSLAVLNAGQAVIFTAGMVTVLAMCVSGIRSGHNTIGDFALLNVMMLQLYQPLNFMGMVYREIRQAIIDISSMFEILAKPAEIVDLPGAPALKVTAGRRSLRERRVPVRRGPAHPARG